jgi:hypothetical protein
MANNRVIKKISLNEDSRNVTIQFRGGSHAIEAKALDFKMNETGNIIYLLLDRIIHKASEDAFDCHLDDQWQEGFLVNGCYVSELTRGVCADERN